MVIAAVLTDSTADHRRVNRPSGMYPPCSTSMINQAVINPDMRKQGIRKQSMNRPALWPRIVGVLALAATLAGCATGRSIMPSPLIYTHGSISPFKDLAPQLQTANVDVMYATDREPALSKDGKPGYTVNRSKSVAFGSAVVRIGTDASWATLDSVARAADPGPPLALTLVSVREQGRAPPTPLPWTLIDGQPVTLPEVQARTEAAEAEFCREVTRRLALTASKEALVYVHGVQNTFADSVFVMAELWHYMGRAGVPIVFSWPAGASGLLTSYTHDRESGEFAIFHAKQFLLALAQCEGVERINIIAHSRGTDVALSALRELIIAERAAGRNPRQTLRLWNIVLAAPDLDLGVTMQRVGAERVAAAAKRVTIYSSQNDKAISISEFLFGGLVRLGQLDFLQVSQYATQANIHIESTEYEGGSRNVALIEYTGTHGGSHGHSYFRKNPAVSSDMVLAVRYDRDPGEENGRPLKQVDEFFWIIDDDYLQTPQH